VVRRVDEDAGGDEKEGALVRPERVDVARVNEPPVVARLVVEIRSDGRHTIARGAMEDAATGRGVAIEASGRSPLTLALSLARVLFTLPALGSRAARALRSASAARRDPGAKK